MSFENINLIEPIRKALKTEGYSIPTPIQKQSIPIILEGKDLLGSAQTGTGKTAAFAIPILQILYENRNAETLRHSVPQTDRKIKALIVTPTRELAIQIGESFAAYGRYSGLHHTVVFGGVSQLRQTNALKKGVDILIATPGRLLDLMNQGYIKLRDLEIFVLDEADRMLDMGFIHDVKKIIAALPQKRQSLFFSATMPPAIITLARTILYNPVKVVIAPVISTAELISQSLYFVDKPNKNALLLHILEDRSIVTALIFTRTKYGADKLTRFMTRNGIRAEAIHGNKSQGARQQALSNFKSRKIRALVASDIAARGLDIDDLSCVINYEIPNIPETYVHRIGRTGRAGATGIAISFCNAEEAAYLQGIQALLPEIIPVVEDHPFPMKEVAATPSPPGRKPSVTAYSGKYDPRLRRRLQTRRR
ncbi:MAG: DEAD/DEAH box helicase [Candidatus Marinimicrobia bacterium]|nr:DEAD/DEAH box helicase [Candidatus Neomarinimicrobiota bacterium]